MININGPEGQLNGGVWKIDCMMASESSEQSGEGAQERPEGVDPELEEAARDEHEYVRERLREELGREPTDEETDEWLRQQTEGY